MVSSYAKSPAVLTATGAAALPALRGASHQVSAVRAPLKREPAEDQADTGREPHAHHQSGVHHREPQSPTKTAPFPPATGKHAILPAGWSAWPPAVTSH